MRRWHFLILICLAFVSNAQTFQEGDTIVNHEEGNKRYTLRINKKQCFYDTAKTCIDFDTLKVTYLKPTTVFYWADSIAESLNVPPKLVYEIGMNESRWPNPEDLDYLIKDGDLQVIDATFNVWYKRLNLTGGKTRYNYLVVGIHYLKYCYTKGGTWRKARYIYGRGRWKDPSQWTKLERHFMNKIDWSQYDS